MINLPVPGSPTPSILVFIERLDAWPRTKKKKEERGMYREEREKKSRMVNVGSDDATALQILHSLLIWLCVEGHLLRFFLRISLKALQRATSSCVFLS